MSDMFLKIFKISCQTRLLFLKKYTKSVVKLVLGILEKYTKLVVKVVLGILEEIYTNQLSN